MKSSILAASLTILLFAACDKKGEVTRTDSPPPESPKAEPAEPPKKPAAEAGGKALAKSKDASSKEEAPAPPPKRLAPEGTYYATQRLSVTNDDGIHSVPPGTRLTLVSKTDTALVVKSGEVELTVTPDQVTNDLDVAARATGAHVQSTAAQSAAEQARVAAARARIQQVDSQTAASIQASSDSANLKQLQNKQAQLIREKTDLQARLQKDQETAERRHYAKVVLGRDSTAVTASPAEVAGWRTRIARIDQELRDIEARMTASR